jgi:WXXGXW repeat (2 copies)
MVCWSSALLSLGESGTAFSAGTGSVLPRCLPRLPDDGIASIERIVELARNWQGGLGRENDMRILRAVLVPLFVVATVVLGAPAASVAQVGLSVTVAPPPLPVYAQPPIPGPGYLWNPGYWNYATAGYYWVPGTWARPPAVGLLWTPGYWGWGAGAFVFHAGYWGPHIGFYGGINYGFGYGGVGYAGGYWAHGAFFYNRSVNNFGNRRITNVYNKNVTVNRTTNVSYNGGAGGTAARPTPAELAADREQHVAPTAAQVQHQQAASTDRELQASVNHGKPPIAATSRPGEFTGHGVEAAHGVASVRPVSGAEHRPAAATGAAARTAPQEHRYAAPQAHHAAPERQARQPAAQQRHAAHEPKAQRPAEHRD